MKSKYKKCKIKDTKYLSNVSNAFCFDTQFDFNSNNNYNNYNSIFSYKTIDSTDEDEEIKENNYFLITLLMRFAMVLFFPIVGWFSFKVIRNDYKLAVFRYGKLLKIINPGIAFVIPLIDSCKYIDTTVKESDIKAAACPTKDFGLIELDCLIKYRITDPTYMIMNVKNWKEFLLTEARVALLTAVKLFRWSDFTDNRIKYDLECEVLKNLVSNIDGKGLEISVVEISNMTQGKEPESPMDVLKKINFKDLGKQLSSMTPLFMNSGANESNNKPDETDSQTSKERALNDFFEKLEIIKNIAIRNMAQQRESEKVVVENQLENKEITLKLEKLIKTFVQRNISAFEISRILSQQSLKPLFDNTQLVTELSSGVKDIVKSHNINGNILFDATNYFKCPIYFHYNEKLEILADGTINEKAFMVTM